ncbi:AAA+ ATPase domain-containing protein [Plasmodiophora brassicae]
MDDSQALQRSLRARLVRQGGPSPIGIPPIKAARREQHAQSGRSPRAASPPPAPALKRFGEVGTPSVGQTNQQQRSAQAKGNDKERAGPGRKAQRPAPEATSPFAFIDEVIANPNTDRFVYLTARGPYDLQVVDHTQINPDEYYTMSRSGITHFFHGETTFDHLGQWEREYFLFSRIMRIRFFAQFRMWKAFFYWKKHIRSTKTAKCQGVLVDNLLILNDHLRDPLLRLRETLVEVSSLDLFHVDRWTTVALPEFAANQAKRLEAVRQQLQTLHDSAHHTVATACDQDLNEFLIQNGFRQAHGGEAHHEAIDATVKISHAERAAIRSECRKLTKFIKLADYFLIDTLVTLSKHCTKQLWDALQDVHPDNAMSTGDEGDRAPDDAAADALGAGVGASKPEPIFSVEVLVDGDQFTFKPSLAEFQSALQTTVAEAVKVAMNSARLINEHDLQQYTQTHADDNGGAGEDADDENALQSIVASDRDFQASLNGIQTAMAVAFQGAREFTRTLDPFLKIYLEPQLDLQAFKDAQVQAFADLIDTFTGQIASFQAMPLSSEVGIIRVESENLKKVLLPAPEARLADVQNVLPVLARDKSAQLLETLRAYHADISKIPDSVDDFVAFMAHLTRANEHADVLDDEFQAILAMYGLIEEHAIRVPDGDGAIFDKLAQTRQTLKTTVQLAEASIEDNISRFSKELQTEIPILVKNVAKVEDRLNDPCLSDPMASVDDVLRFVEAQNAELTRLEALSRKYQYYQEVLEVEITQFEQMDAVRQDMDVKVDLFKAMADWRAKTDTWKQRKFADVDVDAIADELKRFLKTAMKASRMLEGNPVVPIFKSAVIAFQKAMPIVVDLRNASLADRHWAEIQQLINYDIPADPEFTLGTLIDIDAMKHGASINAISVKAVQEAGLSAMLDKVVNTWKDLDFNLVPYKDQKDVWILGSLEDIIASLDESLVSINTISGSRYVEPIRKTVQEWNRKLLLFQEIIDEWITCQRKWRYLETIFSAQDIVRQLPEDSKLFMIVNKSWHEIMKRTADDPNALKAATSYPGLRETLQQHNATLDRIEKRLEDYLETKRQSFPRFYFLSNDELLEILAQSKNVRAVQPHLRKCFDNIVSLDFGKDPKSTDILAMNSSEGERVPLGKNLKARGSVELWLCALETDMVKSLHKFMKQGVIDYDDTERSEWVLRQFGQVVMTVSQIAWARGCEQALRSEAPVASMRAWYDTQVKQLAQLTKLVRLDLSSIDRQKVVALVTTDVHARDVVKSLLDNAVDSNNDFRWQQQLRFYWDVDRDDCAVRQVNAQFDYGYEYMGVTSRLVITPLTDRCWMTITGALHIKLGCSPAGPAGTGKTESVKDLAKALGTQCVVFNCSDQIDYKMMGKLFSGLAQSGAWACLDEFNRIDIEVLSVIAQQLLQIRQALLQSASEFLFMDRTIALKPNCGVMITMNPGYAGRTELPDNLKVLFRPVAMMIPDYALIAEIMLFAEGFDTAQVLSKKMVKLYKLSSEQLSQQDHYDFGMRAVKSVLVMAGALKRSQPNLNEDAVLIRAMRDSNVPKFLSDDLPLFGAIVQDLFPGTALPDADYGDLKVEIEQCVTAMWLQVVPAFTKKIIQLFDTFNVRFGVMLVGPTGSAKSECYRALVKAMTSLKSKNPSSSTYANIFTHVLNPKCITMGELYGEVSVLSQEWTDGLASTIMREAIKDPSTDNRHWVVFDGPVDALWIENMNTVLDDNMTLCLANGERIKLRRELRMLFEVEDLAVASPATVSRCGMVYMPAGDIGTAPYIKSWVQHTLSKAIPEQVRAALLDTIDATFPLALAFQRQHCSEPIPTVDINLAASLCRIYESLFSEKHGVRFAPAENANATQAAVPGEAPAAEPATTAVASSSPAGSDQEQVATTTTESTAAADKASVPAADVFVDNLKALSNLVYVFALIWSVGGSIAESSRERFSDYIRELFPQSHIPKSGTVFEYFADLEHAAWKKWETRVPEFNFSLELPYFQLLVATVDTVTYSTIMEMQLDLNGSVFFTGVTGVGKSMVASDVLRKRKGDSGCVAITMNFSAQTNSRQTQESIESKLEKKRKNLLGGPVGKQVVIFVDDVNMPAVEQYGAQPPIELLRQFQDFKGFYDREKLFWKAITDTTVCCGAAPPVGGRNALTKRFTRHFHMLCMPSPSSSIIGRIFGKILAGYLASAQFRKEVAALADPIVKSTIQLYQAISTELLPIPAKAHYTFNLRDISKIFQGVLMCKPAAVGPNPDVMVRLWIHEAQRCLYDRLIDDADKRWFTERVIKLLADNFALQWEHKAVFEDDSKPLMFADFLRPGGEKEYEECRDMGRCIAALNEYLEEYNLNSTAKMNLVFFADAIRHIVRIARVLRQPRGNLMLVGVGGSGKQSLTRLACAMADYKCVQIESRKGYGYTEFRDDIKTVLTTTGVAGKPVVFLFSDSQIIEERFLEDINNLLNAGEIPNLFANDELSKIVDDLTDTVRKMGLPETRDMIYSTFVSRVRDNLHIVLCLSPVGDAFRVRCRMFPSLINCTTIDWFQPWPQQALLSVASRFLEPLDLPSDAIRQALQTLCVTVHLSVEQYCHKFFRMNRRRVYTTPKSYLDLLSLFLALLDEKRADLKTKYDRLSIGLTKMKETNEIVASLQGDLKKLQPELIVKSKETEELLAQVAQDQENADRVKKIVAAEEAVVNEQAAYVSKLQAEAQTDLDAAMPALEAAVESLNSLNKGDISEVKAMAKPPKGVVMVCEAVNILLGEKPDWDTCKKVMSNTQFLQLLKSYDKDNIPKATIKKVEAYVTQEDFSEKVMAKVSKAALSLCKWCLAIYTYSQVAKEVEPKRARLAEMNAQLADANAKLAQKQAELKAVIDKVEKLQIACTAAVNEKNRLNALSEQTKDRLGRASKLTTGLADEAVRWEVTAAALKGGIDNVVGDVFLASATVSYSGPFTGAFRESLLSEWRQAGADASLPTSAAYSLVSALGDPVEIRDWTLQGLPTDAVSIDSAICVLRGQRWPLMIDPQGQAKKWIKANRGKQLVVIRQTNPNLLRALEGAIRNGNPVLVEDCDETLESSMDPILNKAVFSQGGRPMIKLGDSTIDYDEAFRLYMTTKMANPHYLPEVCIKVNLINFTVTRLGLEDQLLGDVVRKERPDVEENKDRLVIRLAADKKQLKDIGDRILKMLSESTGNILDDEELIVTLADSKFTSNIINERVSEAEETAKTIESIRESYRPVAERGSVIYFVVADLALIDPMYQYSLFYFNRLFASCIDNAPTSTILVERLAFLMEEITLTMYENVCRGLFESHKLVYSFMVCGMIHRLSGVIKDAEWNLVLRGLTAAVASSSPAAAPPSPDTDLITDKGWAFLVGVEAQVPAFVGVTAHVAGNVDVWRAYVSQRDVARADPPAPYDTQLDLFQRIILLKAFREEKLSFAFSNYVSVQLGPKFVQVPTIELKTVYRDTDVKTPVIFVLSSGADPTSLLLRFATEKGFQDKLHVISLGQGQGPKAAALIDECSRAGHWCLLQNCHLAKSWMPALEAIVEQLADNQALLNPDFRLWLTSMPCTYFPVTVLQNGVKLTNEPPKGLRSNLMRSYLTMDAASFEAHSRPDVWKRLLFGLSFFHAVVQERRKFGPLGFNIRYEFNESDLETSTQVLRMFLEEQAEIPWAALRYVCGEINYGGRVTDDWDRRCLMSILSRYYSVDILSDGAALSSSGAYRAPAAGPLQAYVDYIQALPSNETPDVFGMHDNANITFEMNESASIINTIVGVEPLDAAVSTGGLTNDQIVAQMADAFLSALPPPLDRAQAHPTTFQLTPSGVMHSLGTVLAQEVERFNRLLHIIRSSLVQLGKAILGQVSMSTTLDLMYSAFLVNRVPKSWAAAAYPSLKPLSSWLHDLALRVDFMRSWMANGAPNAFWLSGFFFPQGFLTGVLQTHARKYLTPIDTLSFAFEVRPEVALDEIGSAPADGVIIYGLFLDGAQWDADAGRIVDARLGQCSSAMPAIHLIPGDTRHHHQQQQHPAYVCPVYKTSVRAGLLSTTGQSTNFVLAVDLPTDRAQDHWILRGTALLCQPE